jgi:type VI secretion system secreted protein VgrG
LVIFDNKAVAPEMAGDVALRFHGVRATETRDAIDQFGAVRLVQPNSVTSSSWDPEQLFAHAAEQVSNIDAGELPILAIHNGSGERRHADGSAARLHSELVLQGFELDSKQFEGAGAVRQLAAGHAFQLTQHQRYPDGEDRFTVLWVSHEARNNFDPALAKAGTKMHEVGTYRNSFGCVRDAVAIVPSAIAARRPVTMGSQTALVVGLPESRRRRQPRRHRPQHRSARQRARQ